MKHDFKMLFDDVRKGLMSGHERYQVVDSDHICDAVTGLNYHLYDNHYKIVMDDKTLFTNKDGEQSENAILNQVKQMLVEVNRPNNRKRLYEATMTKPEYNNDEASSSY